MIAFILAVTFISAPSGASVVHRGAPTSEAICRSAALAAPQTIAALKNGARFVSASCTPVVLP